jgi:CxxC motif-containing protein (DUF1111 family)
MKKLAVITGLVLFVLSGILCRKASNGLPEEYYDPRLSGGMATTFSATSGAFGEMIPGLSPYDQFIHGFGDKLFGQTFVSAPAPQFPGLGPRYNNVSCISCHHNDGKGTPTAGTPTSSLLTRISISGMDAHGAPLEAAGFGNQLQDKSIAGWQPEIKLNISYAEMPFTFPDGETVSLRKPSYTITNPYQALPAEYYISVRLAPPVFGLGLLELISEYDILKNADEQDQNGDGISGRANYVYNSFTGKKELGRFGLKANTGSLLVQTAAAFVQDMGVTNYVFKSENNITDPNDGSALAPDIADSILNATVFYVRTLAVPARRDVENQQILRGEKLFTQIKCVSCHIPTFQTGVDVRIVSLSNQRIHPYTDLLLHDMGAGLADGRPDYLATGTEWKTPALWGIGLFPKTNGVPFYLHDGRARSIAEAVLWHGGEAEASKTAFTQLTKTDRDALIKFVNSL